MVWKHGSFVIALVLVLLVPMPLPTEAQVIPHDPGGWGDAPDEWPSYRTLGPGTYTGTLATTVDPADWYRIRLNDAARLVVTVAEPHVLVMLVSPSGQEEQNLDGLRVDAAEDGDWFLGFGGYLDTSVGPYTFTIQTVPKTPAPMPLDPVVVATFDTGTNPFHPCFRVPERLHPADDVPGYPNASVPLDLTFADSYDASLAASQSALDNITPWTLHHVPETKVSFYGSDAARDEFIDYYPHGSQASSQIACSEYGMAPNAHLVVLNRYWRPSAFVPLIDWVTAKDWIDVVHLNIQDIPYPFPTTTTNAITALIDSGKLVTIAAGNGIGGQLVNYPQELSGYNGPPGSLVIGATDQDGYTFFSNLDPHVTQDGGGAAAASPYDFGSTSFSGTSSASPLATGYVAWVLGALRAQWGHTGEGLLTLPENATRPTEGPLQDGHLIASELHEVVRKTADPTLRPSRYDGTKSIFWTPATGGEAVGAQYVKAGYGKVSEHTFAAAVAVASGEAPMPERIEDVHYLVSETIRETYWGELGGS